MGSRPAYTRPKLSTIMEKFEVGEEFPVRLPNRQREGLLPMLTTGGGIVCPLLVDRMSGAQAYKIEQGNIKIGALAVRGIPLIAMRLSEFGDVDGYINPFAHEQRDQKTFVTSESNIFSFYVVTLGDKIIHVSRLLGLEPDVVDVWQEAYREALTRYEDGIDLNREVQRVYQEYPTAGDLLDAADEQQVFRR